MNFKDISFTILDQQDVNKGETTMVLMIKTFYYLFYKETNRHCDSKSKIFVYFHSFCYSVDFLTFKLYFVFESESRVLHWILAMASSESLGIVEWYGSGGGHRCGYCKSANGNISDGKQSHSFCSTLIFIFSYELKKYIDLLACCHGMTNTLWIWFYN